MARMAKIALFVAIMAQSVLFSGKCMAGQPCDSLQASLPFVARLARAHGAKELLAIKDAMSYGDRDVLRLYWTKMFEATKDAQTEEVLLELMPRGDEEAGRFYLFTTLDPAGLAGALTKEECRQVSDLVYQYYMLVSSLVPAHPQYIRRYALMDWWASNAEMEPLFENWEKGILKNHGAEFKKEMATISHLFQE
jgi:hypothetical protein